MRFLLLGPLEVHGPRGPVRITSLMQRTMLAALLIQEGRTVSLDRLVEDLWPEGPPKTARKTAHGFAWRLRRILADETARELATVGNGYRLVFDQQDVDGARFERAADAGTDLLRLGRADAALPRFTEALSLWRGPVLENVMATPSVVAYAARLEELRLTALEGMLAAELALGRNAPVIAQLRALVIQHPFREGFHELLMRGLYLSDRRAEALTAYHEAWKVLTTELGTQPCAPLQRLYRQISDSTSGLSPGRTAGGPRTVGLGGPGATCGEK